MKFSALLSFTVILILLTINSTAQTCVLACPDNIVSRADSAKEGAVVHFPAAVAPGTGDCGTITYSRPSGSFFRIGSHSVIVSTSFGQKCFFTVTVTDNEPPVLSPITLSSKKLWSPNNRMKRIAVYYTASDNGQELSSVLTVNSNAPEPGTRDSEIINNHLVRLKTSPLPDGSPRVYTITVTSTDVAGNKTTRTTRIAVSGTIDTGYTSNSPDQQGFLSK